MLGGEDDDYGVSDDGNYGRDYDNVSDGQSDQQTPDNPGLPDDAD